MNRRNFIIAAALAGVAGLGTAFWQAGQDSAYPHVTLDSKTLAAYPDSPSSVHKVLAGRDFKNKDVIVEFVAGWCPHCASLKPEMDKALSARKNVARLTVVVQEGDHKTGYRGATAYVNAFRQMAAEPYFPQVQLWREGENRGYFIGARPAKEIDAFIDQKGRSNESAFAPAPKPA